MDFEAQRELWNPLRKTFLSKCCFILNKGLLYIWNDRKAKKSNLHVGPVNIFPICYTALALLTTKCNECHDDVIKWKHFPRHCPFVRGIYRSTVISSHKGQWRGALMLSFDLRPNKWLRKQSWCWWFETPSRPLCLHCNVFYPPPLMNKIYQFNPLKAASKISDLFSPIAKLKTAMIWIPASRAT